MDQPMTTLSPVAMTTGEYGKDDHSTDEIDTLRLLETGPLYLTETDRVLVATLMSIIIIGTYSLNTIFAWAVITEPRFHTPHITALVAHALYNQQIVTFWFIPGVIYLINGGFFDNGESLSCKITAALLAFPFMCENHSIAVICIERVFYFYKPLLYARIVTVKRMIITQVIIYVFAMVSITCIYFESKTYISPVSLMCYVTWRDYGVFVYSVFYGPALVTTFLCIVALVCLVVKQRNAINVQAQQVDDQNVQQNSNFQSNLKTGIRLIICISSIYYLSFFPALVIVRYIKVTVPITDVELGIAVKQRFLQQGSHIAYGLGFMMYSFMFVVIDKSLRHKVMILLRLKRATPDTSEFN